MFSTRAKAPSGRVNDAEIAHSGYRPLARKRGRLAGALRPVRFKIDARSSLSLRAETVVDPPTRHADELVAKRPPSPRRRKRWPIRPGTRLRRRPNQARVIREHHDLRPVADVQLEHGG